MGERNGNVAAKQAPSQGADIGRGVGSWKAGPGNPDEAKKRKIEDIVCLVEMAGRLKGASVWYSRGFPLL